MKKIPTLFIRDADNRALVTEEVAPGCEWVLAGEGMATAKRDGTCCLVKDGKLYKRYDAKRGKTPPPDFTPAQDPDPITGHWTGWLPLGDGPEDCRHWAAWRNHGNNLPDGTYELVGPKVQDNADGFDTLQLIRHGAEQVCHGLQPTREAIREWLEQLPYEGIVWHHPDGRMCKIKRRDFGLEWPVKKGAELG